MHEVDALNTEVARLLARLDAVEQRLAAHAAATTPTGLTDPDEPTGERWEAGQVWAHMAEFVPYWHRQSAIVLEAPEDERAPFGRTKTDESRIGAIERDRHESPAELMGRVRGTLEDLRAFVATLDAADWEREGIHPVRGPVSVRTIIERFEVDHLEEHADQLDSLSATEDSG
jgi:hypothetical protein